MTRAILIGDGQFELFKDLQSVQNYVEPEEAKSGKYIVYSEDGHRYHFYVACHSKKMWMFLKTKIDVTMMRRCPFDKNHKNELRTEFISFLNKSQLTYQETDLESPFLYMEMRGWYST